MGAHANWRPARNRVICRALAGLPSGQAVSIPDAVFIPQAAIVAAGQGHGASSFRGAGGAGRTWNTATWPAAAAKASGSGLVVMPARANIGAPLGTSRGYARMTCSFSVRSVTSVSVTGSRRRPRESWACPAARTLRAQSESGNADTTYRPPLTVSGETGAERGLP